jgi:hypothetical protein
MGSPYRRLLQKQADTVAPTDLIPDSGQVERMNRTINDATAKRYFYETHDELRTHPRDFVDANNFARRLKTSEASPHTSSSAKHGRHSPNDSQQTHSRKRRS